MWRRMADSDRQTSVVLARAGGPIHSKSGAHVESEAVAVPGRRVILCRLLAGALAVTPALLLGGRAMAQAAAPAAGPSWNQLTPLQREALAPLAGEWAAMPPDSKRKWLEIAANYPRLSPDGKAKMHARMAEFAKLTPEQRRTARENFQRAYELPRESRESAVQQYQALPDDKKKELTERSQRKDAAKAADKK